MSQRRNTEVRLTLRWREMDSNHRSLPRGIALAASQRGGMPVGHLGMTASLAQKTRFELRGAWQRLQPFRPVNWIMGCQGIRP
jgi:hypothetical protein